MTEHTPDDQAGTIPTTKSPDDLLLIREIAAEFRIGCARIRKLVKDGDHRHLTVGRKVLIPRWVMLERVHDNLSTPPIESGSPFEVGDPRIGTR